MMWWVMRLVLSLEWEAERVTVGESEGDDCDEVICAGWGKPGGEWTEWGRRNEEGIGIDASTGEVMHV